jgi:hypothetical protein
MLKCLPALTVFFHFIVVMGYFGVKLEMILQYNRYILLKVIPQGNLIIKDPEFLV